MPVARIISSSFEDALQFADYLRPLFDTVEIAQPGRASGTAVDLEVNLELCTPQEAWRQIAELSQQAEGEIIVAPGTLFAEGENGEESGAVATPAEEDAVAARPQELDGEAEAEVEAAIVQASAAAAAAAGSNGSGTHKAESAGPFAAETQRNWLGRTRESLRQWLAVRALLREIRQMQQQTLAREQNRQRQMALQFERQRRELAMARAAQPRPAALEEAEQTSPGLDAAPLSPAQPILQGEEDALRRQAEQEEAVRRGLFVEEILRRRAQEQVREAPPVCPDADVAPVEFQTVPADSFLSAAEVAPVTRFGASTRNSRLRPAMALAGVTSVLMMAVLVGYAHRRPASPVSPSVLQRSNEVEQTVPFGPASLPAPALAPEATPQTSAQAVAVAAPLSEPHGFRGDFRRVRVDRHEVDYVSDDVTIRHFDAGQRANTVRHPATAVPVTASSRGVKQISDME